MAGPRASLEGFEKKIISCPAKNQIPDCPALSTITAPTMLPWFYFIDKLVWKQSALVMFCTAGSFEC